MFGVWWSDALCVWEYIFPVLCGRSDRPQAVVRCWSCIPIATHIVLVRLCLRVFVCVNCISRRQYVWQWICRRRALYRKCASVSFHLILGLLANVCKYTPIPSLPPPFRVEIENNVVHTNGLQLCFPFFGLCWWKCPLGFAPLCINRNLCSASPLRVFDWLERITVRI